MITGLPDFLRYNLWANLRLLDACAALSDEQLDATTSGVYGSIRQTLMHLVSADEGYADHCTDSMPTPLLDEADPFPGFAALRQRAEYSGKVLVAVATDDDLGRVLALEDGEGGTYEATVSMMLLQAIQHGVDHRSQITTLLSVQSLETPDLDAWSYNDALRAQ